MTDSRTKPCHVHGAPCPHVTLRGPRVFMSSHPTAPAPIDNNFLGRHSSCGARIPAASPICIAALACPDSPARPGQNEKCPLRDLHFNIRHPTRRRLSRRLVVRSQLGFNYSKHWPETLLLLAELSQERICPPLVFREPRQTDGIKGHGLSPHARNSTSAADRDQAVDWNLSQRIQGRRDLLELQRVCCSISALRIKSRSRGKGTAGLEAQ
jgi:hypothetical protein